MTHSPANFYVTQLNELFGAKVTGFVKDPDNLYYGIAFTLPDRSRKTLWLLSDDEGNNPGSFDLTDA